MRTEPPDLLRKGAAFRDKVTGSAGSERTEHFVEVGEEVAIQFGSPS